jgi:hypothetical protein
MKLLISLWVLMPLNVQARFQPVIITYAHLAEARNVRDLLIARYNLPSDFIALRESANPCQRLATNVSWQLCVDADGNLEEVHADRTFIKQTLRIFL